MEECKEEEEEEQEWDVKSYFKESVLVSKRNFHKLLSSSAAAAAGPAGPRKMVIRSRTGQKTFNFNREDKEKENISPFISSSSSTIKRQGIESVIQMLPMDPTQSLHQLVTWLSTISKRIDWNPVTKEISIDRQIKNGSSIVDILTFLLRSHDDASVYPTSHKSGIFKGVPLGTTHFLCTLGEEMYTQGIIDINPNTNEERNLKQLGRLLETTYGLDSKQIVATLALSTPECTRIQKEVRSAAEKKAEK